MKSQPTASRRCPTAFDLRKFTAALISASYLSLAAASVQSAEDEWEFVFSPLYIWGKSIKGTESISGSESVVDLEFRDDILENLDASLSLRLEASRGRVSYFSEFNFATLAPTSTAQVGPIEVTADVEYDDTMFEAGIAWTLFEESHSLFEVLGGARYYDHDVAVDLISTRDAPLDGRATAIRGGDSWWDGFAGVRYTRTLSESWALRLRGDVGYGGSDSNSIHGLGFVDYRFNRWGSVFAGYRFLSIDYDNRQGGAGAYAYDAEQQGPFLGINVHF